MNTKILTQEVGGKRKKALQEH